MHTKRLKISVRMRYPGLPRSRRGEFLLFGSCAWKRGAGREQPRRCMLRTDVCAEFSDVMMWCLAGRFGNLVFRKELNT